MCTHTSTHRDDGQQGRYKVVEVRLKRSSSSERFSNGAGGTQCIGKYIGGGHCRDTVDLQKKKEKKKERRKTIK
jgi:hypothetical protein